MLSRRFFLGLFLAFSMVMPLWAQQEGLLQLNDPLHHFLLRQHTLGRLPVAFLSNQPLSAYEARRYLDSLTTRAAELSPLDQQLLTRFRGEAPGPGAITVNQWIPFTYGNGRDFLSVEEDDYAVQVSPLFYLSYGQAQQTEREGRDASVAIWQNTRGVRAAGRIGAHIFFETRLEENQRRDAQPLYGLETSPRLGFAKFNEDSQVLDYFVATGMVGFRSRFFEVRFGRDRNRWGFARGGLSLSNYSTVYDQLQIRTTFWRLQYTNLYTGFFDPIQRRNPRLPVRPRKFGAFHQLTLDLPGRVQLELFESVTFGAPDTLGFRERGFEISYLNPVIFFRAAEGDRVDPDENLDNVLIGGGVSWIAYPGFKLYTELLIDELRVSQIGKAWWGNKWGWIAGFHLADLPVDNLSLRFEYARLRPYLYSHQSSLSAYVHYNDVLGHPAGPNAEDVALFVYYQPLARLQGAVRFAYTRRGRNAPEQNFGADPLLSFDSRVSDTDVFLLQGIRQTQYLLEANIGYELLPDLFLEAVLRAESLDDVETGVDRYIAPFVTLRWGLPFQSKRY